MPIMLSFLTGNDQCDGMLHPDDGDYVLETDGHTIWVILDDKREESITMANAIDIWINQNKIEKIC